MIDALREQLLTEIADYYSKKLEFHGQTPKGVDWNDEESQTTRFVQLCRVINSATAPCDPFSINDIGCGYGALYDFLLQRYEPPIYFGIDVSATMIEAAKRRYEGWPRVRLEVASVPMQTADYCVASGVFNVRLGRSEADWSAYLAETLETMNETGRKGFAFNCLTIYSDAHKIRDDLYYADPAALFNLCKRRYSRHVALLHDYGLYEFTILVRKQL